MSRLQLSGHEYHHNSARDHSRQQTGPRHGVPGGGGWVVVDVACPEGGLREGGDREGCYDAEVVAAAAEGDGEVGVGGGGIWWRTVGDTRMRASDGQA